MSLTIQTIEELEKEHDSCDGECLISCSTEDCKNLLSAARWALEAGYRPVSTELVSFEEVTKME